MTESPFPTTSGLHTLLGRFRGATAYVIPMTNDDGGALGNNGDQLMHRVFDLILDELEIRRVRVARSADLIVVPPSGALLEKYAFPRLLTERLVGLEDKPLVVFPSSALFPSSDPAAMFRGRTAETVLILREALSHKHLEELWGQSLNNAGVSLHLDHDVVASGHAYVPGIVGAHRCGSGVLVAARRDRERNLATMASADGVPPSRMRGRLAALIPYGAARTRLTRMARRGVNEAASRELWNSVPSETLKNFFGPDAFPRRQVDASATQFATFDEYRRLIAQAEGVVTNRLHIGLPAAILGKPVILVEGGYHKLTGVYAQSIASAPNVTMISSVIAPA